MQFGRMWRKMIRVLDAPAARAASTNSFSFSDSTWPRTTRAMYIHPSAASTRMIAVVACCPKCCQRDGEDARSAGTTRNRSVKRISSWSVASPEVAGDRADDRAEHRREERDGRDRSSARSARRTGSR